MGEVNLEIAAVAKKRCSKIDDDKTIKERQKKRRGLKF
jgi:hypothetical protein